MNDIDRGSLSPTFPWQPSISVEPDTQLLHDEHLLYASTFLYMKVGVGIITDKDASPKGIK